MTLCFGRQHSAGTPRRPRQIPGLILTSTLVVLSIAPQAEGKSRSAPNPIVGYGCSDAVLHAKNQELFFMGFDLGFHKTLKDKSNSHILAVEKVSNGSLLGATASANQLAQKGVRLLVGYPSSHEALLAAEVAKRQGLLAIFAGAAHSRLASFGPNVYTTGESMDYEAERLAEFLKSKFSSQHGLLISTPYAVFSKDLDEALRSALKKTKYSNLRLSRVHLEKDGRLPAADLSSLQKKKISFVLLTTYADESLAVLEQFEQAGIDLPIVANASWTTADIELIRRFLTNRKAPSYMASLWLEGSPDSSEFEGEVRARYGRPATQEMAYGYDLGVIVGRIINGANGRNDREALIASFKRTHCYEGLASGPLCFEANGGHAKRKISFVQFTKNGLKPLRGD